MAPTKSATVVSIEPAGARANPETEPVAFEPEVHAMDPLESVREQLGQGLEQVGERVGSLELGQDGLVERLHAAEALMVDLHAQVEFYRSEADHAYVEMRALRARMSAQEALSDTSWWQRSRRQEINRHLIDRLGTLRPI